MESGMVLMELVAWPVTPKSLRDMQGNFYAHFPPIFPGVCPLFFPA